MSLVLLSDVKAYLDITTDVNDGKLQGVLDAAESEIAQWMSAGTTLASEVITERCSGGAKSLALSKGPVISVTSVTGAWGDTLSLTDLDIDKQNGLINFYPFASVPFLEPWYSVVYTAGFANLAALSSDVVYAVKELVRDGWNPQRGNRGQGANGDVISGRQRAQMIITNRQVSGFA